MALIAVLALGFDSLRFGTHSSRHILLYKKKPITNRIQLMKLSRQFFGNLKSVKLFI